MLTVACVLRSGGDFLPEHVRQLRDGVAFNLLAPHRFVCLSDVEIEGVETVPLTEDWPGWWAKVALFRPGLFSGQVLYFDLDTRIVGELDTIARGISGSGFLALDPMTNLDPGLASGMMAWDAGCPFTSEVYEGFAADPIGIIRRHRGDQDWIAEVRGRKPHQWITSFSDVISACLIRSWKLHCQDGIPSTARVVLFHGQPRPWDVSDFPRFKEAK